MEPENTFQCIYCSEKLSSFSLCQSHMMECAFALCFLCIKKNKIKQTEFICNVCKSLCLKCKNEHATIMHMMRAVHYFISNNYTFNQLSHAHTNFETQNRIKTNAAGYNFPSNWKEECPFLKSSLKQLSVVVKESWLFSLLCSSKKFSTFLFLSGIDGLEVGRIKGLEVSSVAGNLAGECQVCRSPGTIFATLSLLDGSLAFCAYAFAFWASDSCCTMRGAPASESASLWYFFRELFVYVLLS